MNERNGKLRGWRREVESERCALCRVGENDMQMLLKLLEKGRRKESHCYCKRLNINKDEASKELMYCAKATGVKILGKFLYEVRVKWENEPTL
jgi:NADH:ubiquinone oxidoreductase subunit F (NADH-binding)